MAERLRSTLIRWTAPAILLALAGFYSLLVVQYDYNLWAGPNFGMFATAEGPETRLVRCILVDDAKVQPVDCPEALAPAMIRLKGVPTDENLRVVGEQFAALTASSEDRSARADAVRVEIWQFRYEADGSRAHFEQRLAASFDVDGGQ